MTGRHNPERSLDSSPATLIALIRTAIEARIGLFDDRHETAFRLFNGFLEGYPELVIDLYARTAVIFNYANPPALSQTLIDALQPILLDLLPWLRAIIVKTRNALEERDIAGRLVHGEKADSRITEHGVRYAIDLLINQDASLYLDTRNLRLWAKTHLSDKSVLNTFAYTGSYGVAASVGGARRVVHLDINRHYLNLAKSSYSLNGLPIDRSDFLQGDFWIWVNRLKRANELFDCVFLDPPFFSTTQGGRIDLLKHNKRVINKVRPLINDGGFLVAINNALYVSGVDYLRTLQDLCADGYLAVECFIPVPQDFSGYPHTRVRDLPVDPSPFNHSTKIAILRARRKDGR